MHHIHCRAQLARDISAVTKDSIFGQYSGKYQIEKGILGYKYPLVNYMDVTLTDWQSEIKDIQGDAMLHIRKRIRYGQGWNRRKGHAEGGCWMGVDWAGWHLARGFHTTLCWPHLLNV